MTEHTVAWTRLGQTLERSFTAEQAMEEGNLGGWNVRKLPMFAQLPGAAGAFLPFEDRKIVVRDSPVLGLPEVIGDVGNNYQIIQNEDHAALLNALVDESGANFTAAGPLDGKGRKVFLTMKLPGHIRIGGVDQVDNYLHALNSHDGSMSFSLVVTPQRFACKNLLNTGNNIFRVRHTSGAEAALQQQAREALDLTFSYLNGFQKEAEQMIQTTLTQSRFEEIITREFGVEEDASLAATTRADRKIEKMSELFADAMTQEGIRGTVWAGYNALTEWNDHFTPTRGTEPDVSRARKAILNPSFKNRALDLMLAEV